MRALASRVRVLGVVPPKRVNGTAEPSRELAQLLEKAERGQVVEAGGGGGRVRVAAQKAGAGVSGGGEGGGSGCPGDAGTPDLKSRGRDSAGSAPHSSQRCWASAVRRAGGGAPAQPHLLPWLFRFFI